MHPTVAVHLREIAAMLGALPADTALAITTELRAALRRDAAGFLAALDEARALRQFRALVAPVQARRRAAYHEAGHAVSAIVLDLSLTRATILAHAVTATAGSCTFAGTATDPAGLEAEAVCEFAGPIAEQYGTGEAPHESTWATHHDRAAAYLLRDGTGRSYPARIARLHALRAQADDLVARHFAAIQAVAAALLERETLTAADVRAIIDTHTRELAA